MFEKRSKVAFTSCLLATLYVIYLIVYFYGTNAGAADSAEQVGGAIATALVAPHMFLILLGVIFGWIGFVTRKAGFLLTSGILYSVGAFLFLLYAIFVIPILILAFVGYSKQKKINLSNS